MISTTLKLFSTLNVDLCVIGGGPGGYTSAIRGAQRGLKTLCLDGNKLGGTCLNVGCIPSKILLNGSHLLHQTHTVFPQYGIEFDGKVKLNLSKFMKRKDIIVKGLNKGIETLFKKNKVSYINGFGSFLDSHTVCVNNDTKNIIKSKNFIIATGSTSANLPGGILPTDEKRVISSTGALSLKEVPKRLTVIGGGVIGLELGSFYRNLGAPVDIIEYLDKIVPNFDSEISRTLNFILKRHYGFNFYLGNKVIGGKYVNAKSQVEITAQDKKNPKKISKFISDYVLVSTGRRPNTKNLGLNNISIKPDRIGRILVNENCQTIHKHIYAIGDVIPGIMLAHKAEEDGIHAVDHICGISSQNNHLIPSVVYTSPEVAFIGMTEDEIKKKKIPYRKGKFPFVANSRARAVGDTNGFVKVLCEKEKGKILGVHMIGPNVSEMIHECAVAMKFGATDKDIVEVCHGHPTFSESIKEACLMSSFKSINI